MGHGIRGHLPMYKHWFEEQKGYTLASKSLVGNNYERIKTEYRYGPYISQIVPTIYGQIP